MEKRIIFDAHYDILQYEYDENGKVVTDSYYAINTDEIFKQSPFIQGLAAFVHPKYAQNSGFNRANAVLDRFFLEYAQNPTKIRIIKNINDFKKVIDQDLFGVILAIENGSAIQGNIDNIRHFYERGVRMMGVTWNNDNDLACGVATNNDIGLTNLGKRYIKSLNKNKIIVDISHVSEKSFYDIIDITDSPIIASHSCAKEICNHRRNLTDDQIKKIADTGGVIGITFYNTFLSNSGKADITDLVNHIDYIATLVGIEHVGIGTDFQKFEKNEIPDNITKISDFNILFEKMNEQGFSDEEIRQVAGENFVNVLSRVIQKDKEKDDFTR